MNEDKCKYCFHNTAGISCNDDPATCESYEYNHLAEKYENRRYQVKWEDAIQKIVELKRELSS